MEQIKDKIIELLNNSTITCYGRGSCGELGDSFEAIEGEDISSVAEDIVNLIQTVFDPENQPNQLGIENPFKEKEAISFEEATRPLMKYLGENHHPHTSAYVRNDLAELLEGQEVFGTKDYILD